MEQSYPRETKSEAPMFVVIVAWIMLLIGILSLLFTAPLLLLGGTGEIGVIFWLGVSSFVQGVGLVVVSFGIRRMRRWALYVFTALTVLAVGVFLYSFATKPAVDSTEFAGMVVQVLVLAYFWIVSKRFA